MSEPVDSNGVRRGHEKGEVCGVAGMGFRAMLKAIGGSGGGGAGLSSQLASWGTLTVGFSLGASKAVVSSSSSVDTDGE